jgi:hypothetical protein
MGVREKGDEAIIPRRASERGVQRPMVNRRFASFLGGPRHSRPNRHRPGLAIYDRQRAVHFVLLKFCVAGGEQ